MRRVEPIVVTLTQDSRSLEVRDYLGPSLAEKSWSSAHMNRYDDWVEFCYTSHQVARGPKPDGRRIRNPASEALCYSCGMSSEGSPVVSC